jgi:hypothetical protein
MGVYENWWKMMVVPLFFIYLLSEKSYFGLEKKAN